MWVGQGRIPSVSDERGHCLAPKGIYVHAQPFEQLRGAVGDKGVLEVEHDGNDDSRSHAPRFGCCRRVLHLAGSLSLAKHLAHGTDTGVGPFGTNCDGEIPL